VLFKGWKYLPALFYDTCKLPFPFIHPSSSPYPRWRLPNCELVLSFHPQEFNQLFREDNAATLANAGGAFSAFPAPRPPLMGGTFPE
jgi:hypothetical protein